MPKGLTDTERAIIQQVILDRWNPLRLNKKIATHFGLTINQVRHIRSKPVFQAEYKRQLAIYQQSFDEIQLADGKERVTAMQDLYDKIPDIRVALKLKILAQIRAEVGQDQPIQHVHAVHVGVNIPPRAETYEEWLDQNQLVAHEAQSKATVDDPGDVRQVQPGELYISSPSRARFTSWMVRTSVGDKPSMRRNSVSR